MQGDEDNLLLVSYLYRLEQVNMKRMYLDIDCIQLLKK
nr:MAG TPA: hypothetical protein [Caudoviricetes sp.]